MEKFVTDLLANLYAELQEVPVMVNNQLQQFEKSYQIADAKIKSLKEFMTTYSFKDNVEEIKFFKEIKPRFYMEVIYFIELFNIEAAKPIPPGESQKRYYEMVLERLKSFFDQYRDLYNYYRSGKDDQDHFYYVRSEIKIPLRPSFILDLDHSISTPYSLILAYLMAYEQLCSYINNVLSGKVQDSEGKINTGPERKIAWSSSKVDLLELAIALYYSGSVNFGKGGLSNFVSELESFFNIQLGNISRTMLGMLIRKKDATPFLHRLEDTVKHKFDEKLM